MDIQRLSGRFTVKELREEDIGKVLDLCSGNRLFYEYHPPFATRESILEDMSALPPGKERRDKYYVGYYEADFLVAVMDVILDYPHRGAGFVGFFMVDISYQGKNTGSSIIGEMADYLKRLGFEKIRLCIDEGNPQSESFWTKNNFQKTGERYPNDFSAYLAMERSL